MHWYVIFFTCVYPAFCLQHTSPVVEMALDFVAWKHVPPKRKSALCAIFVFAVLYTINVHVVYYYSGVWAYPILQNLNGVFRSIFILACVSVFYVAFTVTNAYNTVLHKL